MSAVCSLVIRLCRYFFHPERLVSLALVWVPLLLVMRSAFATPAEAWTTWLCSEQSTLVTITPLVTRIPVVMKVVPVDKLPEEAVR